MEGDPTTEAPGEISLMGGGKALETRGRRANNSDMKTNLANRSRSAARLRAAIASAALWLPAVLLAQAPSTSPAPAKADPIVAQLVEAHNQERARAGLPPLKLESRLQDAAKLHARDMAEHEFMAHEGTDKSTPQQRVVNAGYRYLGTGENVAKGYREVKEVMQSWMESPPHKKNILGDYTEIGVAMATGEDGKPYWCADFGKPMPKFDPASAVADLVKRINDERTAAKLPALTTDSKLAKVAQERAAGLAEKKSLGGSTGGFEGIDQKLYQDLALSTAGGNPDAESMVKALKDRPDTKSQILGKFARIGAGYATAEDGTPYWCLILANPARR
jgi:uncharacterized protein YkwD